MNRVKNSEGVVIPAEKIKAVQLDPENANLAKGVYNTYKNQDGVEFVVYPKGSRGLKITLDNGKTKYYKVSESGSLEPMKEYKGKFYTDDWKRKLERLCGVTDEMKANKSKAIDYIHLGMFLGFSLLALATAAGVAYLIRILIN